ncbi:MAG: ATP-dependent DNA helicase RecG, partial [Pseudomonadota bacterium]
MAGRPDILFPLFADLTTLPGVGPKMAEHFAGLRVFKPRDLLFTLPHSVIDRKPVDTLQGVPPGSVVTVTATATAHRPPPARN